MEEEFVSDGCTLFPDLTYGHCCVSHDYAYFSGLDKFEADLELFTCVGSNFNWLWAGLMLIGLLLFRPLYVRIKKAKEANNEKIS